MQWKTGREISLKNQFVTESLTIIRRLAPRERHGGIPQLTKKSVQVCSDSQPHMFLENSYEVPTIPEELLCT